MKKENKSFKIKYMTHNYNKSFGESSLNTDIAEKIINMTLEELLNNDDYCNDLILNRNIYFKKLLANNNKIKLIGYSLYPHKFLNINPQKEKKYMNNSCNIICSPNICLFNKSKNNNLEVNKEHIFNFQKIDKEKGENLDDLFENEKSEKYMGFSFDIKSKIENKSIIVDKNDENEMIKIKILDEIFIVLDPTKPIEFNLGNFENIVNSLLLKDPNSIIEYLFNNYSSILKRLYHHLNNYSIEYILDNILNIIFDKEEDNNIKNSKCFKIIDDLLTIINKDDTFEKIEFIFDLFLNNLSNYSGMKIIELFLKDEKARANVINIINKLIIGKNNDKLLIVILNFLCELNNNIVNSISKTLNENYEDNINFSRRVNIFKFKYKTKKIAKYENIFNIFNQNLSSYFKFLNDIFILIAQDIKKNFKCNNQNNIGNNKSFGLKFINEWKIIVNILKLYIYSFFIKDNYLENEKLKLFFDQELFLISIHLYFIYPQNNFFQNIFIEFIKLMNNQKCPDFFTKVLLRKNENASQTEFLFNLINNLQEKNLLIGTTINILQIIYSSSNKIIEGIFNNNELDNIYKNFFMTTIIPKFEMELNNDYEYSFSEIFKTNSINSDSEKTFDGNDSDIPRQYDSFKKVIERFLNKCKEAKEEYIIK